MISLSRINKIFKESLENKFTKWVLAGGIGGNKFFNFLVPLIL